MSLLRHGKSSWDDPGLRDFDRRLAPRGEKAAIRMGQEIARLKLNFDLVLASPAKRVAETIDFLQIGLGHPLPVRFQDDLYTASVRGIFDIIARVPRRIEHVLIVGHNSALQEFSVEVADPDARDLVHRLKDHFPTAAFAHFTLPIRRWNEVRPGAATPRLYLKPKDILPTDIASASL